MTHLLHLPMQPKSIEVGKIIMLSAPLTPRSFLFSPIGQHRDQELAVIPCFESEQSRVQVFVNRMREPSLLETT